MQATVAKTFKEGSVWVALLELEEEPHRAFCMWRWMPRSVSKSGSTGTFRASHLGDISAILERLPEEFETLQLGESNKTIREYEPRLVGVETTLHKAAVGEILLTIHESKNGPWFMLRRIVSAEPMSTANWFYEHHLESLEEARSEAVTWFGANCANAA